MAAHSSALDWRGIVHGESDTTEHMGRMQKVYFLERTGSR